MIRIRGRRLTVCRAGLALAVVAVVVAREQRGVDVDRISDGFAQAVSLEDHVCRCEVVSYNGDGKFSLV
jgi:hypothetical protein